MQLTVKDILMIFTFWWEWGQVWKELRQVETAHKERELYPPQLLSGASSAQIPQFPLTMPLLIVLCGFKGLV